MSKKVETVVEYIKSLEVGEKVSVRSLAERLSVSEGTAYKAIKQAEALALVQTKPKAGTIRIAGPSTVTEQAFSLDAAVRRLGLAVLAGEPVGAQIGSIVIGDSSPVQLRQNIRQAESPALCLVGDRPELQQEAVTAGAHLLVTGGGPISQSLKTAAAQSHVCLLGAQQDSYTVLCLLRTLHGEEATPTRRGLARNWMRTPQYLYYNDIVSDWHRAYADVFALNAQYAIVDDDLKICGSLDAANVLSAAPTEKLYNLYSQQKACCVIREDMPMERLAEKLISEHTELAFVEQKNGLCGLITANDVLRYYRYGSSGDASGPSALELSDQDPAYTRQVYLAHFPEHALQPSAPLSERGISALLSAAMKHAAALLRTEHCLLEAGTFYAPAPLLRPGEVMISSEVMKRSREGCSLEVEMYDESACYGRCTLTFSAVKGD